MKKVFVLLGVLLTLSATTFAQNTQSRQQVNGDISANSLSIVTVSLGDTVGATLDTVYFTPRHSNITLDLKVKDSCTLAYSTLAGLYQGDHIFLNITNPAQTGVLKLYSAFIVSTGTNTISLTANKHCTLEFWLDISGKLVEISRNLNY